jgi:alpha-beta hydrolase superfamily lysophospholipase
MTDSFKKWVRSGLKLSLVSIFSVVFVLIVLLSIYVKGLPETDIWHTRILTSEFNTESKIKIFSDYLDLEKKLFLELNQTIIQKLPGQGKNILNRFYKDSPSNPESTPANWNRSFVLETQSPRVGVLLLHGMSDSPYSLRNIGLRLNKERAFVVGLRLPGHGTGPSGLLNTKWEDMAKAVKLSMEFLFKKTNGAPIYIVGYSTGGALGLQYQLLALEDPSYKKISGLVLISPAIGVAKVAALAKWQERLSKIPGLGKLAWTDILPEYDPYKYNSFAVNAGNQVYRLTNEIRRLLLASKKSNTLKNLPKILAFQSIADATVSTHALLDDLFLKLPKVGHELVVFDINRTFGLKSLISKDPVPEVHQLLERKNLDFTLSFITNKNNEDRHIFLHQNPVGTAKLVISPLNLSWPRSVYSLSHVALPFPKTDPLYGILENKKDGLNLGDIALRGERGLLKISPSSILRLRYNPFYPYMEDRILKMIFSDLSLTK